MRLSLVIPVHDDTPGLTRLLEQVPRLGVFAQVIVVDDASPAPCTPAALGIGARDLGLEGDALVSLRLSARRGAGHARNRGFEQVTGSHVLFFDADDLLTDALAGLVTALEGQEFDFAIFRHGESRMRAQGRAAPMPYDEIYWNAVPQPLGVLAPAQAAMLCRISAYPWNKIYRSDFLRAHAIGCTEIAVHNDIELHWLSFLHARRILAARTVCAEHIVRPAMPGGAHLTHRRGAERLEVFAALRPVLAALHDPAHRRYLVPFLDFCLRLGDWIEGVLDPALRPAFDARMRAFLREDLCEPLFRLVALDAPALAVRLNARMDGEGRV